MDVRPNISEVSLEHVLCVVWNVAFASMLGLQGKDEYVFQHLYSVKQLIIGDLKRPRFNRGHFLLYLLHGGCKAPSPQCCHKPQKTACPSHSYAIWTPAQF
jgi:hypothetical protein